jgi:small GTP-binding protein
LPNPNDLLRDIPAPARPAVRQIRNTLPVDRQRELDALLSQLPSSVRPLKDIIGLVTEPWKPILAPKQRIAVVGPANVGKSTLYNQLITRKEDRAAVSPVPGTTRLAQEADAGLFSVVDTPGADAVGEVGERERQIALGAAAAADFLVIVFDAIHGIRRHERDLFDNLAALGKPYVVVLNKIDLVAKADRDAVIKSAATGLRLEPSQIIDTVATDGTNVGRVILAVARTEPGLLAALADALPEYRAKLAWGRIVPAGAAAATVALVPLPLADVVPLLAIQTGLVLSISRIYGFQITAARARELIVTFGVAMVARTLFQQLSKLGGVPGWLLSSAIATSTTVAIGYAAMTWFGRGERPTKDAFRKQATEISLYLRNRLADLGKRKPDEGTLKQRVTKALQDMPRELQPKAVDKGPVV